MALNHLLPISIEEIHYADLPQLRDLCISTFNDSFQSIGRDFTTYTEENFNYGKLAREMINPDSHFYFIYYNHNLAGYLKLNSDSAQSKDMGSNTLEIDRIYLRQYFEYMGLESNLIEFSFDKAKELKKDTVWSRIWEHDEPVIQSYKEFGFKTIDSQDFKIGDHLEKDLVMQVKVSEEVR